MTFKINIPGSTNCEKGYLEIRDGNSHSSPLIDRIYGVIWSTGNRMLIDFVTDMSVNSDFYGYHVSY